MRIEEEEGDVETLFTPTTHKAESSTPKFWAKFSVVLLLSITLVLIGVINSAPLSSQQATLTTTNLAKIKALTCSMKHEPGMSLAVPDSCLLIGMSLQNKPYGVYDITLREFTQPRTI